jgi:hypothetical protein
MISALAVATPVWAQHSEGLVPTQALVAVDGKAAPPSQASDLTVTLDGKKAPLASWTPVRPDHTQVALLIDDGLRESVGRNLNDLQAFLKGLPAGVEVLVGYMQNGRVVSDGGFTTDHMAAAGEIRLPTGMPGQSASPYFCLSDFVKHWPGAPQQDPNAAPGVALAQPAGAAKARFVMMITNGVDPYNGSTSPLNQDSPYVATAVRDAQRAGVAVYSIYFSDAGMRGQGASFSGQSYLQQLADGTGARIYADGMGNPVTMEPFLRQFTKAIASTYIAGFEAPAGSKPGELVRFKIASNTKAKLHAPDQILPGNME